MFATKGKTKFCEIVNFLQPQYHYIRMICEGHKNLLSFSTLIIVPVYDGPSGK